MYYQIKRAPEVLLAGDSNIPLIGTADRKKVYPNGVTQFSPGLLKASGSPNMDQDFQAFIQHPSAARHVPHKHGFTGALIDQWINDIHVVILKIEHTSGTSLHLSPEQVFHMILVLCPIVLALLALSMYIQSPSEVDGEANGSTLVLPTHDPHSGGKSFDNVIRHHELSSSVLEPHHTPATFTTNSSDISVVPTSSPAGAPGSTFALGATSTNTMDSINRRNKVRSPRSKNVNSSNVGLVVTPGSGNNKKRNFVAAKSSPQSPTGVTIHDSDQLDEVLTHEQAASPEHHYLQPAAEPSYSGDDSFSTLLMGTPDKDVSDRLEDLRDFNPRDPSNTQPSHIPYQSAAPSGFLDESEED